MADLAAERARKANREGNTAAGAKALVICGFCGPTKVVP
jgi:hypothetical protein